jgi:hypothetical protein
MPRAVTVVFSDGKVRVYENVPDDVTPDQVEDRARGEFPDRQITEVMGGNLVNRQLRDAIATRQATVEDLQAIARRYDYEIQPDDLDTYQQWIDFAANRPNVAIPENIHTAPVSRTRAFAEGVETGTRSVSDTLVGAWAWLADKGAQLGITPTPENATRIFARLNAYSPEEADAFARNIAARGLSWSDLVSAGAEAVRQRPIAIASQEQRAPYFTGGNIAAQIATTAPAISTLATRGAAATATAAPRVSNFFRSVGSGGIGVRAATPEAIAAGAPVAATFGGRVALRAGGGATAGVAGSTMTGSDADQALFDGLIGGTIPFGATLVRRGAGATYDLLAGRLGETRAAEIFRNLIANNTDEIMTALREAPANARANVAEFLASRRVTDPVTGKETSLLNPEIAAATRIGAASSAGQPLTDVAAARSAGQDEMFDVLRGGQNPTEAMENVDAMRRAVRDETEPMRQAVMERADIGRKQIIPAENRAAELRFRAAEEARRAARLYRVADDQTAVLNTMFQNPAFFTLDGPAARVGQLADDAGRRADESVQRQFNLQGEARSQQEIADNLRAQGLSPLDISGVVGNLRAQAREAAFVSPQREKLFNDFATALENRAAMYGGIIDATGLHLAKRDIGEFVADVMGQADPSSVARGTSMLAGETQRLINDAFEAAAGPEWGQYNRTFSSGMQGVERQAFATGLAGEGDAPARNRLERVMRGGDPRYVENFFGPGRRNINVEMFGSQLPGAHRLAREIRIDRDVANLGLRGLPVETRGPAMAGTRARVTEMMAPGLGPVSRAFFNVTGRVPGLSGGGIAAEQVAREFSERMSENAMRNLVPALADPAEAVRLAGVRSANAMTAGAFDRLPPMARTYASQTLQQLMNPPAPQAVMPSEGELPPPGQVFLGFQTGPNGEAIPIYGPAGGL